MSIINSLRFNPFMTWLRGDSKSLHHRFFTLPLEHLEFFFFYKLRGKTYTHYYQVRMERQAKQSFETPFIKEYLETGVTDLEYLKKQGMQPHHRLLDFGCGTLRTGLFVIPYLDPGNYVGVDISETRIEKGCREAENQGIPRDRYRVVTLTGTGLEEIADEKIDYVWSLAVFSHMPSSEWYPILRKLHGQLSDDGKILISYSHRDKLKRSKFKDFWYTSDHVEKVAAECGYKTTFLDDWNEVNYTAEERIVLLTKA